MNILKFFGIGSDKSSRGTGKNGSVHFPDATDWHSHILPGVDDGFQEMEQSLHMLRTYEKTGLKHLWLTPHIMEDVPNETSHLREVFAAFQEAYDADWRSRQAGSMSTNVTASHSSVAASSAKEQPGEAEAAASSKITLHLAAENMLDPLFEKRLRAKDLLPLGEKADHLLVETSIFAAPSNFLGLLERIKNAGYTPVLAHPERYLYMEKSDYEKLKAMGIQFQRNLFSLKGQYGDTVRKRCKKLMKWDMYDYVGSDLHREGLFWRYW